MKIVILILALLNVCESFSQNLVLNGGFEDFDKCPQGVENKSDVLYFVSNPNKGSFDFIDTCDLDKFPRFYWGNQRPRNGEGIVGIVVLVYSENQSSNMREYIQLELKDSLIQGGIYKFEMYLSLADKWNVAINKMGVYFCNTKLNTNNDELIFVKPDIVSDEFFSNKLDWDRYTGNYLAKGGEKFIIIGNFQRSNDVRTKFLDGGWANSSYVYYYIDDVSLILNEDLASGIAFNNIKFFTGSSILQKESFPEIKKISKYLKINTKSKIEIIGYTDNEGSEKFNIKLSNDRARSVAEFLIKDGVSPQRINCVGKGSFNPISDNSKKEGRFMNRRVEIRFLQDQTNILHDEK